MINGLGYNYNQPSISNPMKTLTNKRKPSAGSHNCTLIELAIAQVPKPYYYPVYKNVPVPVPKAVHKIVPVIKEKPVIVKKKVPIL